MSANNKKNESIQLKSSVAYQNKDIISKVFGENMKNKSFKAYGYDLPQIVNVLPTNLPVVEANELRLDNLFELEDRSLALVDYESTYDYQDKITYLNYVVRTLKRNSSIEKTGQRIRVIIIYTGNIKRAQTNPYLNVGCLQFSVDEIFLSELDSEEIEEKLKRKVEAGERLSEDEQMQFIILPLTYEDKESQQKCIKRCIDLAEILPDYKIQSFVLAGLLVFTDKVIKKEDSERIRRWLNMTQVGRIILQEMEEAVEQARKEERANTQKVVMKSALETAGKLYSKGFTVDEILDVVSGISKEQLNQSLHL